ncbi:hypothetical protein EHV15_25610 [Paenibacillus oralis]|uniref:Uncharacterized protein n=1 Tax=Paenibacillus oralis TaxID=2490856 RepID=A0A3P3U6B7_9BACL|nr:hypothetical protein [Paenibacillus oralis]RRJ65922.1 hypothetical protein EHV15_25610 [Paenibacillus oralis]
MSRILFWDPGHGSSASVAAVCAVTMGLHFPLRVLLFNDGRHGSGVEEGLRAGSRHASEAGSGESGILGSRLSEYGIEALLRLSASGMLTKANYSDYTLPVIRGRLDLATGFRAGGLHGTSELSEGQDLLELALAAEQSYDLVLRHAPRIRELPEALAGSEEEVVVAVLQQRRSQLDDFFDALAKQTVTSRRKLCVILAPYDSGSGLNLANLKRRYRRALPVFGIPYDTEFANAWNDRDILSFFRRYRLLPKRGGSREAVLASCRDLSRNLLELTGKATLQAARERGA